MNREQRRLMPKQNGVPSQVQSQAAKAEFYQGSVPPPAMLSEFGKVNISFPERIFKMAEDAGERQMKQLENQEKQIELETQNEKLRIEASERLKAMEIKARNADARFKNIIALIGVLTGTAVCGTLLCMAYMMLQADKSGYALGMASPVIGAALIAAIKILRK